MKVKKFDELNESAPIVEVEFAFEASDVYKNAAYKIRPILDAFEMEFYKWCEENGHEGAEGDTDYDMSFRNIIMDLVLNNR